jgi:PIN domain nuclease of toxin-antitoxin system
MTLLVDTHALLWFLLDDDRLSPPALNAIRDRGNRVMVSATSAFEIATKHRIGKLGIPGFEPGVLPRVLERAQFETLPITLAHALVAGSLTDDHRDPFDRMLLAQCRVEGFPLVTRDPIFARAGVPVVW